MQLLEYFKDLTVHPKNAEEVKGLILQLAVQGKLTQKWREENPDVESASLFFERIKERKESLIKVKTLKKEADIFETDESEFAYRVPSSWKWLRLGEVMSIIRGVSFKKNEISEVESDGAIGVLRGHNMNDSKINKQNLIYLSKEKVKDAQIIKKGDIAITLSSGSDHLVGKIGLSDYDEEFTIGAFYGKLLVFEKSLKFYLLNYLDSPLYKTQLKGAFRGIGINNLSNEKVKNLYFPLPPLAEQKTIVKIVNQLFTEVEQLDAMTKERIQLKEDFVTSALNQLTQASGSDVGNHWDFLKGQFSTFFTEKENIKKLREAILQLAVQGKLTHHWRTDVRLSGVEVEPASTLLERIKAEKKQLIKEKKIKKEKPLPTISEDEIPYDLPEGWIWCRLTDLTEVGTGSTPSKANSEYYIGGTVPWYTSSATNDEFAVLQDVKITDKALKETNCKIFPSGSLIIAMYGQGKTRGQISELVIPGATNQAIAAMVFFESSKLTKQYLKYYFQKFYHEIRLLAEGGAQPNLNVGKVKATLIPIPPTLEIEAIVKKVNDLMDLCHKLEKEIDTHQTTQEQWMQSCLREVLQPKAKEVVK